MPTVARNIFPQPDGRFRVRYRYGLKDCKRIFESKDQAEQFLRHERELIRAYGQLWKQLKSNQLSRLLFALEQLAPGDTTEGLRILERLVKAHEQRPVRQNENVTVGAAADSLFAQWEREPASEKARSYHRNAGAFIRGFVVTHGARAVREVTPAMVRNWVGEQSPGNRVTAKARISLLFRHCTENDWRKDNPACGFNLPKRVKDAVQVPGAAMIARFMAMTMETAYQTLRTCLALRLFAGLRTTEAKRIEWMHIDFERRMIRIPQGVAAKNGEARSVPIADNLAIWLALDQKRSGRVAPPDVDRLESCLRANFRAREGIILGSKEAKVWDNVLRHSYGSYRYPRLENLERLAAEMGNSRRTLLSYYVGVVSADDEKAFWEIRPLTGFAANTQTSRKKEV